MVNFACILKLALKAKKKKVFLARKLGDWLTN